MGTVRRERVSRQKTKVQEKVEKTGQTAVFQCSVALRDQKMHAIVARKHFEAELLLPHVYGTIFGRASRFVKNKLFERPSSRLSVRRSSVLNQHQKLRSGVAESARFRSNNPDLTLTIVFGGRHNGFNSAPCQRCAGCVGFAAISRTLAGVGRWERICKDAFCVPDRVQTCQEVRALIS